MYWETPKGKSKEPKEKSLVLRFHSDPDTPPGKPGIIPWLEVDPETGRAKRPTAETMDEFLALTIYEEDAVKLADAMDSGIMKSGARYSAAMAAWINAHGEQDLQTAYTRIHQAMNAAEKMELLVESALKEAEQEPAPLEDSVS